MEVTAIARNVRISPRKMRLLADVFKKTKAVETLARLHHVDRAGSLPLSKLIASAVANAQQVHKLQPDQLTIKNIEVNGGVSFKRFRAVSRGSAHSYKRRSSHVTVVLEG
jgi:large subunit ribosomal protein L22